MFWKILESTKSFGELISTFQAISGTEISAEAVC